MSKNRDAIAVILALGWDNVLDPLTVDRAAPAVPFGGNFRIIDFALTNCLNSGLRQILVLTENKSHSLMRHLRDGWSIFNPELGEYITPVPPQMMGDTNGYASAVDALRQNLYLIERSEADAVVVIAGDEIYRMDYAALLRFHRKVRADVTVVCVDDDDAKVNGAALSLTVAQDQRVVGVSEIDNAAPARGAMYAMGVLVISTELLGMVTDLPVTNKTGGDAGTELLPALIGRRKVMAYRFGGSAGRVRPDRYWCKPRSVDDYYRANMDLLELDPPLDLYQRDWPIRTYQNQVPPARTVPGRSDNEGVCVNSIVSGGGVIAGGGVNHSVLFPGVRVGDAAIVQDSILLSGVVVGESAHLHQCIIEKSVIIPAGESIGVDPAADRRRFTVTDAGIAVVPKAYSFLQP